MLRIIVIAIEIIIAFLLQTTVFKWFELAGTVPNLLLILTVACGFIRGKKTGMFVGIVCGLLIDFMYGDLLGLSAALYMLIGYLGGYFGTVFNSSEKIVAVIITGLSQFAYFILYYTAHFLLRGRLNIFYYFIKIGLPEIVYTTLCAIIFYRIFYFIDERIDSLLKEEA